ncbi:MAG: outer membrane protein assembly factor BamE [Alphaproteobacteria bacterium]|nr:outer membrane protein assembly factor BamE [Alphaproteobacteria bacterium]
MTARNRTLFSNKLILIAGCTATLMSAACSPTIAQRGNMLENYQLAEVKPGESGRSDVLRALGSPTTQSTFDKGVWYYIGQETEKRGILDPKVTKERIFQVAFSEDGILESIQEIDRDRINVPYVRTKTPTHGNETTIMQQFLGNLGKFNPQTEK